MATGKVLNGKPYAGKPHIRFDEGEAALSVTPRRGSLLYKVHTGTGMLLVAALTAVVWTAAADAIASRSARTIVVSSKCDLARGRHLNVSSATREGIEELEDAVARALEDMAASPDGGREDETSSRIAALASAARSLRAVAVAPDPAAAANSAAAAARILGEAAGAEYSNDLMDRIFSRFCVGK